jgi:hypothetical protein
LLSFQELLFSDALHKRIYPERQLIHYPEELFVQPVKRCIEQSRQDKYDKSDGDIKAILLNFSIKVIAREISEYL